MAAPTIRSSYISTGNTDLSATITVGTGDLVVIAEAGASATPTFTYTGTAYLARSRTSARTTSVTIGTTGVNNDISLSNTGATLNSAIDSYLVIAGGTLTVTVSGTVNPIRWAVYAITPPAGTIWPETFTTGSSRYARLGSATTNTATSTITWASDNRISGYGGFIATAIHLGTAADRYFDFGYNTIPAVRSDQAASLAPLTAKTVFDYNDAAYSSSTITLENSAGTAQTPTSKAWVGYMYTLGPPIVVNAGTALAREVELSASTATRIVNIGTAAATNPAIGAWTSEVPPRSVGTSDAAAPAMAQATITRIAPVTGNALSTAQAKAPIAPWLLASPLQLVARETGTPNFYDVTAPVKTRINRTEDYDAFGADLGFTWDGGNGQTFIAFGDTFGSNWIGPFGGVQGSATSTIAVTSSGQNVATVTEIYVGSVATFSTPSNQTEGYRNVTTQLSNGTYATLRYTGRDTVNNKLTGVSLVTGSGTLIAGNAITTNDPRSDGGWRSQTLAISTDTDLSAGYTIDRFIVGATGAAKELVPAKHSSDSTSSRYTNATSLTISTVGQIYGVTVVTTATPHGLSRAGQLVYLTGITGTLSSMNNQDWPVYQVYDATTFFILTFGPVVANTTSGTVKVATNPNPSATTSNPEVTLVPTGGVAVPRVGSTGGYRQYMFLMSVNHWGDNGGNLINHCVISYSDDGGENWTKASWRWDNDVNFTSKITQIWPTRRNGYVYGLCGGIYRYDPPVVIRCVETDLLTQSAWEYWDGSTWVANSPSSAAFVWETGLTGAMGEPAVYWSEGNQCWVSTYLNAQNWIGGTGIEIRSASSLTGPWSTPQMLHQGTYWDPDQGIYGGFIHPWSAVAPQASTDLYFHVSLFAPYSTYLMKASLGVPLKASGEADSIGLGSATIVSLVNGAARSVAQGSTSATGVRQIHIVDVALASTASNLDVTTVKVLNDAPQLSASGALTVAVAVTAVATAAFSGLESSSMTVIAVVIPKDGAGLSAYGVLTASAEITATTAVAVSGASTLSTTSRVIAYTALSLTGAGALVVADRRIVNSTSSLSGSSSLAITPLLVQRVALSLAGNSGHVVATRLQASVAVVLTSSSTFFPISPLIYAVTVAANGSGGMIVNVSCRAFTTAALGATGSMVLIAGIGYRVALQLTATSTLLAYGKWVHYITNVLRTTSTRKVSSGDHISVGQYEDEGTYATRKVGSGIMTTVAREQT